MDNQQHLERWALQRAQQILMKEGVNLINAAQWLDKKLTRESSTQLREAISQSLLEAMALRADRDVDPLPRSRADNIRSA